MVRKCAEGPNLIDSENSLSEHVTNQSESDRIKLRRPSESLGVGMLFPIRKKDRGHWRCHFFTQNSKHSSRFRNVLFCGFKEILND